jgi:hypothetical protein
MNVAIRKIALPFALAAILFGASGCKKKKPAVPPPQAEAPTLEAPQPATPPAEATTAPAPPADTTTATTTTPAPAPKPKKPRTKVAKKPSAGVAASTANNGSTPPPTVANSTSTPPPPGVITTPSGKVIVPEGSAPEPTGQISTTMPTSKENETKLNTERSLQTTEKDLKAITWAPSMDQKNMMEQIKTYIVQSRSANNDGDVLRASNLAQKARLLCDELLKK